MYPPNSINKATSLVKKGDLDHDGSLVINVFPCNHGEKTFFMVVPPVPLGTNPGIDKQPVFILTVNVLPFKGRYTVAPSEIQLEDESGNSVFPIAVSIGSDSCGVDIEPTNFVGETTKRLWDTHGITDKYEIHARTDESNVKSLEFSVMFDGKPPSLEDKFYITVPVYEDHMSLHVPKITFIRETIWGGW